MKTMLELNEAVRELFASNQLPESYLTVSNKQIYVCSPCGEPIIKLQYLGTSKITNKDIPTVYNIIKNFVNTHLQELKDFFKAKVLIKVPFSVSADDGFRITPQKINVNGVRVHKLSVYNNNHLYLSGYYSDNTLCLKTNYTSINQAEDVIKIINEELKLLKKAIKPHLAAFNEYAKSFDIVNEFKQKYLTCS